MVHELSVNETGRLVCSRVLSNHPQGNHQSEDNFSRINILDSKIKAVTLRIGHLSSLVLL